MMEILTSILYSGIGFALGWFAGRQARNIEQIHEAIVPTSDHPTRGPQLGTVAIIVAIILAVIILILGKA